MASMNGFSPCFIESVLRLKKALNLTNCFRWSGRKRNLDGPRLRNVRRSPNRLHWDAKCFLKWRHNSNNNEELTMWTKPTYIDMRLGFEVTMYFANR